MTTLSALPPGIYYDARAILIGATEDIAIAKNVLLAPGQEIELAEQAMGALQPATLYAMIGSEPEALIQAAGTINTLLDLFAAIQVIQVMCRTQGFEANREETLAAAGAWIKRGVANDTGDRRFRWPEPMTMAVNYFKARSSGPVEIQFSGSVTAAYHLDRSAFPISNAPTTKRPESFMPEPLLIRCPAFSPIRCVVTQPRETADA